MSFLNALKQRSEAVKAVTRAPITTPKVKPVAAMPTREELKADALDRMEQTRNNVTNPGTVAAVRDQDNSTITVTVDQVVNKNRIDIFFSRKPSDQTLDLLRKANWWYRPSDKAWFNKDSSEARLFCVKHFAADFDAPEEIPVTPAEVEAIETTGPIVTLTSETVETIEQMEPEAFTPDLTRYKKQIDELLAHLKCDSTDLLFMAMDAFHKRTFSKDA